MRRTLNLALTLALAVGATAGCAATKTQQCTTTSATQRVDKDTSVVYTAECGVLKVSDDAQREGRMIGNARYLLEVRGDRVVRIVDRLGRAA